MSLEKGSQFLPLQVFRVAEKIVCQKYRNFINWPTKRYESQSFLGRGDSAHPNSIKPFEYEKSWLKKLFAKRFQTQIKTNP